MNNAEKCYAIGDISDMCNVPIKTLRYYDEIGLLVPSHRDPTTNYRYYSEDQMLTLYIIRRLKSFGFTLEEIRNLVYSGDIGSLGEKLSEKAKEIGREIESLCELKHDVEFMLERIKKGGDFTNGFNESGDISDVMTQESDNSIAIEHIPEKECIFTRRTEKDYKNAYITVARWFEIFSMLKKYNLKSTSVITLTYHNEPLDQFLKKDCDLEISTPITQPIDAPFCKKVDGYDAVTTMHVGSHSRIINTHIKALRWMHQHNYEVAGCISEEFIVSPLDVKNENDYLTKIIIPIK